MRLQLRGDGAVGEWQQLPGVPQCPARQPWPAGSGASSAIATVFSRQEQGKVDGAQHLQEGRSKPINSHGLQRFMARAVFHSLAIGACRSRPLQRSGQISGLGGLTLWLSIQRVGRR